MPIKKTLLAGAMSAFLLGAGLANAEEVIKPEQPLAIETTLEEKISKPKVEINFNYKTESEQKGVDYQTSNSTIYVDSSGNYLTSIRDFNIPELTLNEENQVKNIIKDIQNENINSYQEFVEISKNLSENQKLLLSSIRNHLLHIFNYDINLVQNEVVSQEEFFDGLQNSLISGNQNPLGACGHFATDTERFLNDMGIKSAAVSGISKNQINHVYDISKIEDGTAIIDSYNILITNTKNIEKTLEAYQKNNGTTTFQHPFFEDTKFKYRLITKDGRRFLDFVGYDESSQTLKDVLLHDFEPEARLKINIDVEDYLTSVENNLFGLFVKAGEIRGDSSSPMEKLSLMQTGFKRKFLTPDMNNKFLNFIIGNKIIDLDGNFLCGNLFQDTKLDDNRILGLNGNLVFSTNNEKGFNLDSRIAGNINNTRNSTLFYDSILGAGISYKILTKPINIEPYVVSQFSSFKGNIDTQEFRPFLSELSTGTVFDIKTSDNINLLVEPYYLRRIWEQEFGINTEIKGKYLGLKIGEHITKSNYDFCPGKFGFDVGLTMDMKEFLMNLNYSIDEINYDGEIERQHSLNVEGKLKF